MDLLITIVIAGMAVGFSTELIDTLFDRISPWYSPIVKKLLAAPFGALYCWLLGLTDWVLLIGALASAFIALIVLHWINRPVQIQQVVSNRMR